MSSLPSEILEDVLRPLDRWTLGNVHFTKRRIRQLIMEHLSDVCLRQVYTASFRAPDARSGNVLASFRIRIDSRPQREGSGEGRDAARTFSEFASYAELSRRVLDFQW